MFLSIKSRLALFSALSLVGVALSGGAGLYELRNIRGELDKAGIAASAIRNQLEADMMHDALRADVLMALRWAEKGGDPAEMNAIAAELAEHGKTLRGRMKDNASLALSPGSHDAIRDAAPRLDAYVSSAERLVELARKDPAAANASFKDFLTAFSAMETAMAAVSDRIEADVQVSQKGGDAAVASGVKLLATVAALALLVCVLLGRRLAHTILRPLQHARESVERIAHGDLTRPFVTPDTQNRKQQDEIAELMAGLETMRGNLRGMIGEIDASTRTFATSTRVIVESMADMDGASTRQSEAAADVATVVEQLQGSLEQVAENARSTEHVAVEAGQTSGSGSDVMHMASQEMNRIVDAVGRSSEFITRLGDQSARISEIVDVITDIADQTNLLALNAAIEAARAGDHGRGFAVVADEVRQLAVRTAKATREISSMIGDILTGTDSAVAAMMEGRERVGDGVAMIAQVAESMSAIKEGSVRVVEAVQSISSALQEQTRGNEQIVRDTENIANLSLENARAAREVVGTAETLDRTTTDLLGAIKRFRV